MKSLPLVTALFFCVRAWSAEPYLNTSITLSHGMPLIAAKLGGIEKLTLLVDTGGFGKVAISGDRLDKSKIAFNGRSLKWNDSQGRIFESRLFDAADLEFGGVQVGPMSGSEWIRSPESLEAAFEGYLGVEILDDFALKLNYTDKTLQLFDKRGSKSGNAECGQPSFSIQLKQGIVLTRVESDKGTYIFQIDTGSRQTFMRPGAVNVRTNADGSLAESMISFAQFKLGDHDFGRQVVYLRSFKAPAVDGVLGSDFLQGKTICLDAVSSVGSIN